MFTGESRLSDYVDEKILERLTGIVEELISRGATNNTDLATLQTQTGTPADVEPEQGSEKKSDEEETQSLSVSANFTVSQFERVCVPYIYHRSLSSLHLFMFSVCFSV